jgi:thiazole synthase ThiGH ThiG subunit
MADDRLIIAGREFKSRLWVGTGKYKNFVETQKAIEVSGADVVTVAVRSTTSIQKNIRSFRTRPAVTRSRTRFAMPGWRARPGCPTW